MPAPTKAATAIAAEYKPAARSLGKPLAGGVIVQVGRHDMSFFARGLIAVRLSTLAGGTVTVDREVVLGPSSFEPGLVMEMMSRYLAMGGPLSGLGYLSDPGRPFTPGTGGYVIPFGHGLMLARSRSRSTPSRSPQTLVANPSNSTFADDKAILNLYKTELKLSVPVLRVPAIGLPTAGIEDVRLHTGGKSVMGRMASFDHGKIVASGGIATTVCTKGISHC